MILEPRIEFREKQEYLAIRKKVTMNELGKVLPPLHCEIYGWMSENKIEPAGPPFFRYLVIDMEAFLEIDVGVPVSGSISGNDWIKQGVLPDGKYAVTSYFGHYDNLVEANAEFQIWTEKNGTRLAVKDTKEGTVWESRVEFYINDPGTEFDPDKWHTDIAYLISD